MEPNRHRLRDWCWRGPGLHRFASLIFPLPHPDSIPSGPCRAVSTDPWMESALSLKFRPFQLYLIYAFTIIADCFPAHTVYLSKATCLPLCPASTPCLRCSLPGVMLSTPPFSCSLAVPPPSRVRVKSHLSWSFPTPIRTRILPYLWRKYYLMLCIFHFVFSKDDCHFRIFSNYILSYTVAFAILRRCISRILKNS